MGRILIKNGKVWNGEEFSQKDILTDGEIVSKIEENITDDADYIFDATGKIVSAGLVDIHTHMLGGFGINAELSCIPFGVTAAADACAPPDSKEKFNNYLVKNKVFVMAEFRDNKLKPENTLRSLEYYGEKAAGIKVYFDTEVSEVRDISPLKEICSLAKSKNLIVMVHCSNSPAKMSEIVDVLSKGDIITHAYHGGASNASEDNFECFKKAREKGIIIDAGFAGYVHTDFEVFKKAVKNGAVPDVISTDITRFSAYKRGGIYGMTMCMEMAKENGMSEEEIFRCVTSTPAKALSKEDEWGYLKIGRCADLSVFDRDGEGFSLTDAAGNTLKGEKGYRCVLCVCDGEVVYRI